MLKRKVRLKSLLVSVLVMCMVFGYLPIGTDSAVAHADSLTVPARPAGPGRDYFVSTSIGDDAYSGTYTQPWRTLYHVNRTEFQPGDRIFFRAGDEWRGQLNFSGFGTDEHPIIVGAWGPLAAEAIGGNLYLLPAIHGMGGEGLTDYGQPITPRGHFEQGHSGTLMMVNTTNWTVRHLQITNDNPDPVTGEFIWRDNIHQNFVLRHPHAVTEGNTNAETTAIFGTGFPMNHNDNSWRGATTLVCPMGTLRGQARPGMGMNMLSFDATTRRILNERNGVMAILNPDILCQDMLSRHGKDLTDFRMRNVTIEGLYIRDVDGIQHWGRLFGDARFQGAILIHMEGSTIPGMTFEYLTIYNNVLNRVGTMGIAGFDFGDHNGMQDYFRSMDRMMQNVYIGYNYMTNILGGIINWCNSDRGLIEHNVGDHWGRDYSRECAGMYSWHTSNIIYSNNIVSNGPNRLGRNGGDGGAFDIDSGLINKIHEFNYSFNNPMGTLNWLGRNFGSIWRYNIHDRDGRGFIVHGWYGPDFDHTWFLNNVFYFDSTSDRPITAGGGSQALYEVVWRFADVMDPANVAAAHRSRGGRMYFINNIFYDFGDMSQDDETGLSHHWAFQAFNSAGQYRGSDQTVTARGPNPANWTGTCGFVFWNNAFYFANLPDRAANPALFDSRFRAGNGTVGSPLGTGAAFLPWHVGDVAFYTGEFAEAQANADAYRSRNNIVQVNPRFMGMESGNDGWLGVVGSEEHGIVRLPGPSLENHQRGRPTLNIVQSTLPRNSRQATPHAPVDGFDIQGGSPFPDHLSRVMNVSDPFWRNFTLHPQSPLLDAGFYVPQMGTRDFFGTRLYWGPAPAIGVYEHTGGGRTQSNIFAKPERDSRIIDRHDYQGRNPDTNSQDYIWRHSARYVAWFWDSLILNPGAYNGTVRPGGENNLAARSRVTTQNSENLAYFLTMEMVGGEHDDGGTRQVWNSANTQAQWIEIDFEETVTFDTVRLYEWIRTHLPAGGWNGTGAGGNDGGHMRRPNLVHYTLSRWDGSRWIAFHDNSPNIDRGHTAAAAAFGGGSTRRALNEATFIEDRFAPVTTSRLRIDLNELADIVYLHQIEVYMRDHEEVSGSSVHTNLAAEANFDIEQGLGHGIIDITLPAPSLFNRIRIADNAADSVITSYVVEVEIDEEWVVLDEGNSVGLENLFFDKLVTGEIEVTNIRISYENTTGGSGDPRHPNLAVGVYLETGFVVQERLDPVLEAAWSMDDNESGSVVTDTTGNNRNLTVTNVDFVNNPDRGVVAYFGRDGERAAAHQRSYLTLPNAQVPDEMLRQYSVSMFVKPDSLYMGAFAPTNGRNWMTLFSFGNNTTEAFRADMQYDGPTGGFQSPHRFINGIAGTGAGQIRFHPGHRGSSDPTQFATTNEWNHVTFTFDGFYYRTFVNGVQTMNVRITDPHGGVPRPLRRPVAAQLLSFGRLNPGTMNNEGMRSQFFGAMDDMRMYSTALTIEQIIHEHSTIEVESGPSATGFRAGYAFDLTGFTVRVENDFYNINEILTAESFRFYLEVEDELIQVEPDELLPAELEPGILTVRVDLLDNTLVRTSFEVEIIDSTLRGELAELIAYAEALDINDYTRGSWTVLYDTLVTARTVYNNQQASDEHIENAITNLESAISRLVLSEPTDPSPIDVARAYLRQGIEEAEGLVINQFSRGHWILLQENLDIARGVYANTNATLSQLEQALIHLNAAMDNRIP
jgi:hypothetical protein